MATEDFLRFHAEYLPQHPELRKKLDAMSDGGARVGAMVAAGREAKFIFSAAEAALGLQAFEQRIQEASSELTDAEVEGVSGGLQEATQHRPHTHKP